MVQGIKLQHSKHSSIQIKYSSHFMQSTRIRYHNIFNYDISVELSPLKSSPKFYLYQVIALGTDHLTCRGGGYGFLLCSETFFRTTRELEYLFFLSCKARNFFPEFNIRLYDKNSESHFFFLHQNQNIFFSNIGNQNIFLEKKHNPHPPFSS